MVTSSWAGTEALYRHAFKHWPAESYQVIVFHHEPIQEDDQRLIEQLSTAPQTTGANVAVSVIDTTEPMAEPMQTLWYTQTGVEPPWVVVTAPGAGEATPPVWAGSLRAEAASALLDSPARRKIAERLLDGDAAVWVLLECGDAIRDEAAVDLLAAELRRQEVKLSSRASPTNAAASFIGTPMKGGFSLVRVTRNDSAEEFFASNLLNGSLLSHVKPMAFPVYGRGRMLPVLVGKRLNAESIADTCVFITSACTNKAKAANPGKDLLLSAHWDAPAEPTTPNSLHSAPAAVTSAALSNSTATAPSPLPETNSTSVVAQALGGDSAKAGSNLGMGLIIALVTGVLSFFVLRSRRGPSS